MKGFKLPLIIILLALFTISGCTNYDKTVYGTWNFNKEKSTDIVTWRYRIPQVVLSKEGESEISMVFNWLERNKKLAMVDAVNFAPGGEPISVPVEKQFWLENWYMGVLVKVGTNKIVSGEWQEQDRALKVQKEQTVETSQGDTQVKTTFTFSLDRTGDVLTVKEERSTRPTPITLVFDRVME